MGDHADDLINEIIDNGWWGRPNNKRSDWRKMEVGKTIAQTDAAWFLSVRTTKKVYRGKAWFPKQLCYMTEHENKKWVHMPQWLYDEKLADLDKVE